MIIGIVADGGMYVVPVVMATAETGAWPTLPDIIVCCCVGIDRNYGQGIIEDGGVIREHAHVRVG